MMFNFFKKKESKKIEKFENKNQKRELIPVIKESKERKLSRKELLDSINFKEYISNNDDFIERFKKFHFNLGHPKGSYKLFCENFPNEHLELDYEYYNQKFFNFKRNIEKQIFEKFVVFLNIKIANQLYISDLKSSNLEIIVWNVCPIHKDEKDKPNVENINKEMFCTCTIV